MRVSMDAREGKSTVFFVCIYFYNDNGFGNATGSREGGKIHSFSAS